jgi:hypothetical protein
MATTTCINHPNRAAIESCEVCGKPLCAYCLYYTEDGQRLCREHAEHAHAAGAHIRTPEVYADGLIAAQVNASRPKPNPPATYEADTIDVLALVGLVVAITGLMVCIPPAMCLIGPVGLILSVISLAGARNARNPSRVRTMAGIGASISALWVIVVIACILAYSAQVTTFTTMLRSGGIPINSGGIVVTVVIPVGGPHPGTATPTASP